MRAKPALDVETTTRFNYNGAAMLTQLTIHSSHGAPLAALRRALRDTDVRISGEITRRGDRIVEVRVATADAAAVSSLCRLLVEADLAETVDVEQIDVDEA